MINDDDGDDDADDDYNHLGRLISAYISDKR